MCFPIHFTCGDQKQPAYFGDNFLLTAYFRKYLNDENVDLNSNFVSPKSMLCHQVLSNYSSSKHRFGKFSVPVP